MILIRLPLRQQIATLDLALHHGGNGLRDTQKRRALRNLVLGCCQVVTQQRHALRWF
jgi:hypothetical protein